MFTTFGNKVRIKKSTETERLDLAGKIGEIHGETTPSIIDVEVIGKTKRDYALNVYFNDLEDSLWFDSDLIEPLDEGQGTEIAFDGIDKKWTKTKKGQWTEEGKRAVTKKNWWQFWKKQ